MEGCYAVSGEALIAFILLHRSTNPLCSLTLDIPNPLIPSYYFHVYIMRNKNEDCQTQSLRNWKFMKNIHKHTSVRMLVFLGKNKNKMYVNERAPLNQNKQSTLNKHLSIYLSWIGINDTTHTQEYKWQNIEKKGIKMFFYFSSFIENSFIHSCHFNSEPSS